MLPCALSLLKFMAVYTPPSSLDLAVRARQGRSEAMQLPARHPCLMPSKNKSVKAG